jgi:hypothetical protein
MIPFSLANDNRASWVAVLAFVRQFPEDDVWKKWRQDMSALLEASMAEGLDNYFRAGQSMQHIIFSTAEKHGLEYIEPQPPRVTVGFNKDMSLFVAWSNLNIWLNDPTHRDSLDGNAGFNTLKHYLAELWSSTRPYQQLPPSLASLSGGVSA